MRRDRMLLLTSVVLVVFVYAMFLPVISVHTYCENRVYGAAVTCVLSIMFVLLLVNRAGSSWHKVICGVAEAACIVGAIFDIDFVLAATRLCGLHPYS